MPFHLRLAFTGICAFIPNKLSPEEEKTRMCVVLPDGRSDKAIGKFGEDGMPLRRHKGFIQMKARQLAAIPPQIAAGMPDDAELICYLDRHRVTFGCTADEQESKLDSLMGSPDSLAPLESLVPQFSALDPEIISPNPPAKVLAQVFLSQGFLRGLPKEQRARWVFPSLLTANRPSTKILSHEISLEVPYLEKFSIATTRFGELKPEFCWELVSRDGEDVTVTIANLCDENPLRWKTLDAEQKPDEDFRWYYTLLTVTDQRALFQSLGGLPFPIPLPSLSQPNGQGANCVPAGGGTLDIRG
ncbi:MAG TPA: hypothetical protein VH988_06855 [Thermoanaerobaculia bacterium]|jgi:hypothetical protein|nr:hypothetical protein [Thermoanaerobaculia bacterium]